MGCPLLTFHRVTECPGELVASSVPPESKLTATGISSKSALAAGPPKVFTGLSCWSVLQSNVCRLFPADAKVSPFGLNASDQIRSFCAVDGGPRCLRVFRSHNTSCASPPAATVFPSGLQARLHTGDPRAPVGGPNAARVATSQNITVWSMLPEINVLPSGAKARLLTCLSWPDSGMPLGCPLETSLTVMPPNSLPDAR